MDSLVNEVIVRDTRTIDLVGTPQRNLREAIRLALGVVKRDEVPTVFTDADLQPFHSHETHPSWAGGTELIDVRAAETTASPERVFAAVTSLGGTTGWHSGE